MIPNVAGVLIFFSVCGIVASNPDRAVDCRKFVFAPLCRGVAAKRGVLDSGHYGQEMFLSEKRSLLSTPQIANSLLGMLGAENDQMGLLANQHESQKLVKMSQLNRRNHFSRLMLDNRRSNSGRDNLHAQDIEDL